MPQKTKMAADKKRLKDIARKLKRVIEAKNRGLKMPGAFEGGKLVKTSTLRKEGAAIARRLRAARGQNAKR